MTIDCIIFFKKTHKSTRICERNLITQWSTTCFGHLCGHLLGGKNNNTNIILACQHQSKAKNHTVLVKIPVNDKTAMSNKYYNLKVLSGVWFCLMMAAWVRVTCRWSLWSNITIINPSEFVVLFNNFFLRLINARNMEHIKRTENASFS